MNRISRLVWLYGGHAWLVALVPSVLKFLSRLTYNRIAKLHPTPSMTFMNLGFIGNDDEPRPILEAEDEPNRLAIQLYHHVGTLIDVSGLDVLEVGSGRGGGASYVTRYFRPASMVGMDLSADAVAFCQRQRPLDGLRFQQGDAERMPFNDQQFDVVMNVESSHCYPSLAAFFREVTRVLRPGGHFLYTDIMIVDQLPERRNMLDRAGLELLYERDIRLNVLASLDATAEERTALSETLAPALGLSGARQWTVAPGSKALAGMRAGVLGYVTMTLRAK